MMMKKFIVLPFIIVPLIFFFGCAAGKEEVPFGLRYIHFLNQKTTDTHDKNWELLFAPTIQKIVNSKIVCTNRAQLIQQMINIETTYGVIDINLLDFIMSDDEQTQVVQFEVTFKGDTTETVIAILKSDDQGLIKEINEVFGQKAAYQWQP